MKKDADIQGYTDIQEGVEHTCSMCDDKNFLLEAILSSGTLGLLIVGIKGNDYSIVEYNHMFTQIFEVPEDILMRRDEREFRDNLLSKVEDPAHLNEMVEKEYQNDKKVYHSSLTFLDGKIVEYTSTPMISSDGSFFGRILEFDDVTFRMQKEEELRTAYSILNEKTQEVAEIKEALRIQYDKQYRKTALLSAILNSSVHGILVLDEHKKMIEHNRRLFEIMQLTKDHFSDSINEIPLEFDDVSIESLLANFPDLRPFVTLVMDEIDSPAFTSEINKEIVFPNGTILDCFASPVVSQSDEYFGTILEFREVTAKRRDAIALKSAYEDLEISHRQLTIMEKEIWESSQKLKNMHMKLGVLSSITHHDVFNQIMVVLGINEILLEDSADEDQKELIDISNHALKTVQKQLTFAKSLQEGNEWGVKWYYLHNLVEGVTDFAQSHFVTILQNFDRDLEIYVDSLFEKVIYTLVENAVRHGEGVKNITISFSQDGARGVLSIADDGVGVLEQEKLSIFQKGFGSNTGLGLFLSKTILDSSDISIHECGTYGEGAKFVLLFREDLWRVVPKKPSESDNTSPLQQPDTQ